MVVEYITIYTIYKFIYIWIIIIDSMNIIMFTAPKIGEPEAYPLISDS